MAIATGAALAIGLGSIGAQTAVNAYQAHKAGESNDRAQNLQHEETTAAMAANQRQYDADLAHQRELEANTERLARERDERAERARQEDLQLQRDREARAIAVDNARYDTYVRANAPMWEQGAQTYRTLLDFARNAGGAGPAAGGSPQASSLAAMLPASSVTMPQRPPSSGGQMLAMNASGEVPARPATLDEALAQGNQIAYGGQDRLTKAYWADKWAQDPEYAWKRMLGWQAGGSDVATSGPYSGAGAMEMSGGGGSAPTSVTAARPGVSSGNSLASLVNADRGGIPIASTPAGTARVNSQGLNIARQMPRMEMPTGSSGMSLVDILRMADLYGKNPAKGQGDFLVPKGGSYA